MTCLCVVVSASWSRQWTAIMVTVNMLDFAKNLIFNWTSQGTFLCVCVFLCAIHTFIRVLGLWDIIRASIRLFPLTFGSSAAIYIDLHRPVVEVIIEAHIRYCSYP